MTDMSVVGEVFAECPVCGEVADIDDHDCDAEPTFDGVCPMCGAEYGSFFGSPEGMFGRLRGVIAPPPPTVTLLPRRHAVVVNYCIVPISYHSAHKGVINTQLLGDLGVRLRPDQVRVRGSEG